MESRFKLKKRKKAGVLCAEIITCAKITVLFVRSVWKQKHLYTILSKLTLCQYLFRANMFLQQTTFYMN